MICFFSFVKWEVREGEFWRACLICSAPQGSHSLRPSAGEREETSIIIKSNITM